MTTQEKMIFEERLSTTAVEWAKANHWMNYANCYREEAFENGAHWAREETIREVLGLLRSESADTACGMMELEFKDSGNQHVCSTDWADWLESKLNSPESPDRLIQAYHVHQELTDESEVKLKNPIYRWPDDEL